MLFYPFAGSQDEDQRFISHGWLGKHSDASLKGRQLNELSFQAGSIIIVHRLSETSEGWIVGTLDGKKGYVPASFVEILE